MVVQEPSKALRGGVVVEDLPGPVVEAGCNIREVLGSVNGQVRVFRKVLAPEHTVRYALDGAAQPLAVASYTYDALPEAEHQDLPSPEAIVTALELDDD